MILTNNFWLLLHNSDYYYTTLIIITQLLIIITQSSDYYYTMSDYYYTNLIIITHVWLLLHNSVSNVFKFFIFYPFEILSLSKNKTRFNSIFYLMILLTIMQGVNCLYKCPEGLSIPRQMVIACQARRTSWRRCGTNFSRRIFLVKSI